MTDNNEQPVWMCDECGYLYDPEEGDPDGGVVQGTPFGTLPAEWLCPVCNGEKSLFRPFSSRL